MLKARIWATAEQLQDTALKSMFDAEGYIDCTLPELAEEQRRIGFEQGLAAQSYAYS